MYLVGSPFAIASPVLKGVDDCQEFLVVDFVIYFRWLELPGMEGHWVQSSLAVSLREYCSNGKIGGVGFDYYWFLGVEVGQYRC